MNPETFQILLNSLKADMILSRELLKETAVEMVEGGYTSYPIFIAHQMEEALKVGEPLIDHKELGLGWSVQASTLQEFLEKGLIKKDREAFFKETYKDPMNFACFFLIDGAEGHFVFVPFESEKVPNNPHHE